MKQRSVAQRITSGTVIVVLSLAIAVMSGCASQPSAEKSMNAQPAQAASQGNSGGPMEAKMTCLMCSKGAPAAEKGTATEENGVQVVNVVLKDGYYSPNEITIKAGIPAKLIFTGEAKDCAGKPKIEQLGKQADFTATGEATMDLGTPSAGTYPLTCGMGSAGGTLVVQ